MNRGRWTQRRVGFIRSGFLLQAAILAALLFLPARGECEARVPLAQMGDETIYVDEVEGALAMRIFKHKLDIYSLLVSEAERRLESGLLEREAERRGISVDELLAEVEGSAASIPEVEVDRYLAEHPPRTRSDASNASDTETRERERVRHYLAERAKIERRVSFLAMLREKAGAKVLLDPPAPPRTEIDVAGAHARGPETAPVVIVQFTSLGSRNAARSAKKIDRLRAEFPGKIRQVHRHFLRSGDEVGLAAARVSTAAETDPTFWAVHDAILDDEEPLSLERLIVSAERAGISTAQARAALSDIATVALVKRDIDFGIAAGVPREPSLFINGRFISGLSPYDEIKKIVTEELPR